MATTQQGRPLERRTAVIILSDQSGRQARKQASKVMREQIGRVGTKGERSEHVIR